MTLNAKNYTHITGQKEIFETSAPNEQGEISIKQIKFRPTFNSMHKVDDSFNLFLLDRFEMVEYNNERLP